jgi:hypothetical protein
MPTLTNLDISAVAANEISSVARIYGLPVSEVSRCVTAAPTRQSFKNAIRKKAQSYWFSLVQPFEDSVVEFFPEEIDRQRVRGKIRLPFALSLHESNGNSNGKKSVPSNRRWSSGSCTYVTATLPLTEQLSNDEYEVGVPVTVYFVRVRRHDDFKLNLREVAGADGGADIWAQGVTASVSRRGERFVTLLAQAELPQALLDRFDVRCTERDEGVRSVVGISCLTGASLCDRDRHFEDRSNPSNDRDHELKYLRQFVNDTFCSNLARKLSTGTEIVEFKLF